MYKVFHQLAGDIYNASDIEHCLKFAEDIRTQYPQMVFTIYVVSNNQLNTLIGVTGLTVSGNTFTYGNISGVIETERIQQEEPTGNSPCHLYSRREITRQDTKFAYHQVYVCRSRDARIFRPLAATAFR